MIARAPGKLVLSGAYAVLYGAPAVVTAVNRYATATTKAPAEFVTPEVQRALPPGQHAPAFDASQLRAESGKLGLGSSAAILVASLGALVGSTLDAEARQRVFERALRAHREAQGGGSGIDVAASVFGGTLLARLVTPIGPPWLTLAPVALPSALSWSFWSSGRPALTQELLRRVAALEAKDPQAFSGPMGRQVEASELAAGALERADPSLLLEAMKLQLLALGELGTAARAPIVSAAHSELALAAHQEGAVFYPAGAGGGDVAVFVGPARATLAFREQAGEHGFTPLDLDLGAPGLEVHPHDSAALPPWAHALGEARRARTQQGSAPR